MNDKQNGPAKWCVRYISIRVLQKGIYLSLNVYVCINSRIHHLIHPVLWVKVAEMSNLKNVNNKKFKFFGCANFGGNLEEKYC